MNIGNWTIEQQHRLNNHFVAYTYVRQDDLPTFLTCLSKSFLVAYLQNFVAHQASLYCLTTTDLCLIFEAEKTKQEGEYNNIHSSTANFV